MFSVKHMSPWLIIIRFPQEIWFADERMGCENFVVHFNRTRIPTSSFKQAALCLKIKSQ